MTTTSTVHQPTSDKPAPLMATVVADSARPDCLPRFFGARCVMVENTVFSMLKSLSSNYHGGFWTFHELSNGGFFMAPETNKSFHVFCDGNGYEGEVSANAAGIIACLFTFSRLSFSIENERLSELFHLLRDYASEHPEASAIFRAID